MKTPGAPSLVSSLRPPVLACALLAGLACLCPGRPARAQAAVEADAGDARAARAQEITQAIEKAMQYVEGKESQGLPHYNDNIVDFALTIVQRFPQYGAILDSYKKWITENDAFVEGYPYWSIRHVLSLGSIGEEEKATEIFSKLKPIANDGEWETSYHIGFYLYGCIVAGEAELLEKTTQVLAARVERTPDKFHYFTAYWVWKAHERTQEEKYKTLFLKVVETLKPFKEEYVDMAATDGHMGQALCVFCRAFALTRDEEYRELSTRLVDVLLGTQAEDGSWNGFAGYAVMPAAGMALYLDIL